MAFQLVSSVKRNGSSNAYFVQRIPTALRERAAGLSVVVPVGGEVVRYRITEKTTTIRLSLRTAVPSEVKVRQAEVAAYFETLWQSLRSSKPVSLTHRQCVALAGDIYRAWTAEGGRELTIELQPDRSWLFVEEPFTPPEAWHTALDKLRETKDLEPAELEPILGPIIAHALRDRGIAAVDEPSREMILREFHRALRDAFTVQGRQASGDYTPAREQERFPAWEDVRPLLIAERTSAPTAVSVSLKGLVDGWWSEAKRSGFSQSTFENYRACIGRLAAFLQNDDAKAVTHADLVRFKDHRLAIGIKPETIKAGDLAALKSIFGFAVANGLLPANPADSIKLIKSRRNVTRARGFTTEEAEAILAKSMTYVRVQREKENTASAKRWVPWLCAYTGARVGEIVQLRREDMREEGGLSVLTITPEAGTVKTKELRHVVLHPHLVELGFMDFVRSCGPGHLFFEAVLGEDTRGKRSATKNRVGEFAREVVPDKQVAPSHGWRHAFKTRGREAGIEDSILDAICGHAPGSVGREYGVVSLQAQARALGMFPRFGVG